jgi:hypothetical protein
LKTKPKMAIKTFDLKRKIKTIPIFGLLSIRTIELEGSIPI